MDPAQLDINSLVLAITSFIAAPTWKAVVTIVGVISLCIVYLTAFITKYLYDKNKREADAYNEALRIKKEQEANLQKMQKDAIDALIDNMDTAYQQDYDYFVEVIKKKNYKAVYAKIATQFHEKIAQFMYSESLTPEQISAMIIREIRKK